MATMMRTTITADLEQGSCCHRRVVFRAWDGGRVFEQHSICGDSDAERVLAHWEGFRSTYEPRPEVRA